MKKIEVEVFSEAANAWVVRTPGRQYPGVVVQGDTLHNLACMAEDVLLQLRESGAAEELVDNAQLLCAHLSALVDHYAATLAVAGMKLPYFPRS